MSNDKEYFTIINTRDNGIEIAYLTREEIIDKTADLFEMNYVYARNREGILRQILDVILLDDKNEAVSTTALASECGTDAEYQFEIDQLLKNAEVDEYAEI
ncbi:hypothetical protein NIE88_12675 [Sporolactobacillus shoreicorticis]|uniref:Phage protein n=1 Tax=Sporolactobacillus shoreicorticis TaxID=1923877 RepID=A0ABW5S7C7_9BACL|nr:hypothetical protein [Sporolactobacillus shoreicorticis]MCO7126619.1 hypothetical protein [Sporolactobacillus shoreicorticis]